MRSILKRLIDFDFALVQMLVPIIKAEYGPHTGDLFIRDLGDQLHSLPYDIDHLSAEPGPRL